MPRHNKPHLHTYLDRQNIFDIYKLWNDGKSTDEILEIYGFSITSLNRILNVHDWTKHQRITWGSPPTMSRPRYDTPHPFDEVQKGTQGTPGEGSKYTAPPADPSEFIDPPPSITGMVAPGENTTMPEPVLSIDNIFKPLSELEKWLEKNTAPEIPELDHISAALENRLNQHEVEHRIEAVQICFDMLQEEFTKLKILIRD